MAKFAFLLHHTPSRYENLNEDEFMGIMKDYIGWVEKASEKGIYAGGEKLSSSVSAVITSAGGGIEVHESPSTELAEILGGVMFVKAQDMSDAIKIARDHPHLVHNSKIEIRQVEGED